MPPIEEYDRWQSALYWARVGRTRTGDPLIENTYTQVYVRWEKESGQIAVQSREYSRPSNDTVIHYDASVFTAQNLVNGSILWEGGEKDLDVGQTEPTQDFFEVVAEDESVPDLKNRFRFRCYRLVRYGDSLPPKLGS